jgi:hypothetical protein
LVDIERPEDPITYIAMYILKNQNKSSFPFQKESDKRQANAENNN